MRQIRMEVIDLAAKKRITNAELKLLLYAADRMDQDGTAVGIYQPEVCAVTGMSKSTFHAVRVSLEQKGIIRAEKHHFSDWDITILRNQNTIPDRLEKGLPIDLKKAPWLAYVSSGHPVLQSPEFGALKSGEKLLAIYLIGKSSNKNGCYRKNIQNFYREFTELLGVQARAVRGYLHRLKCFFTVGNHQGNYYIELKKAYKADASETSAWYTFPGNPKAEMGEHEPEWVYRKKAEVETVCRRCRMYATKTDIRDVVGLYHTFKNAIRESGLERRMDTYPLYRYLIRKSKKQARERIPVLSPPYINKLLQELLQKPEMLDWSVWA